MKVTYLAKPGKVTKTLEDAKGNRWFFGDESPDDQFECCKRAGFSAKRCSEMAFYIDNNEEADLLAEEAEIRHVLGLNNEWLLTSKLNTVLRFERPNKTSLMVLPFFATNKRHPWKIEVIAEPRQV